MITFKQFQASKKTCPDLGAALSDSSLEKSTGLLYLGALYIETNNASWKGSDAEAFAYMLTIGREQFLSNDLAKLEQELFEFARDEGYLED